MNNAIFLFIDKSTNPLKGNLSYFNFYLNGQISKLLYNNELFLNEKECVILFKNEINNLLPEKIVFFVNFKENIQQKIEKVKQSLNVQHPVIIF